MSTNQEKVFYYRDEQTDDFAQTVQTPRPLPENYRYISNNPLEKLFGFIAYRVLLKPFAWLYLKLKFHHTFVKSAGVKSLKGGHLIYGNHTALFADVFQPSLIKMSRKNYLIAGEQANSLTGILWITRSIGAIPLTKNVKQNREMLRCIKKRLQEGASVTIFPEAHVWPYYTKIRPYPSASFKYAAIFNAPVVCMTTCYQKRNFSKTPKMITYLDGPFYPDPALSTQENAERLHAAVIETMQKRTEEHSTYSVYEYIKVEEESNQ